ncbi:hypothetical protein NKG95_06450 [Mesorhizobium sp. M1423]|jgi:hypothetical protein|uniref:hypothetical protein n=1 Tax=Mesorhizobium sp. M1423 TaxID=2957101 RepID=UPI00333B92B5
MTAQQITLETMTMAHLSGAVELSRQVGGPVVARSNSEAPNLIDFLLADSAGEFVRIDTESTDLGEWLTRPAWLTSSVA